MKRAQALLDHMTQADIDAYWQDSFDDEPIDAEWSRAMSSSVEPEVRSFLPAGAVLEAFSCRSSLCRVVVSYTDIYDHNALVGQLYKNVESFASTSTNGMISGHRDQRPDGGATVTFFLAKKGRLLIPQ